MTTFFISRHPGALEWMQVQGIQYDEHLEYLDPR
jgi:putative CRISPR-associated protein (TIGR02620 family)